MLSRKAKYAIKALLALAEHEHGEPVRISDLARAEQIPPKFLELILLGLRNQGILRSRKGRAGDICWPATLRKSISAKSSGCPTGLSPRSLVPVRRRTCPVPTAGTRRSAGSISP